MSGLMQVCSDSARRPLRERAILWRQRVRTAAGPQELVARYLAARQACELPDWRSEATFLRVLQPAVRDEGTAAYLLQFFADQPEVQRYLARLILRRADDPRVVAVVERVLFGEQINWASVDAELASVKDPALRLERLQQVLARAPDDPNGIIRLVHALSHAGQLDEALVVGRRLRDAGLATPFLSRELGDLLAENALVPEALRTYSEIVEFDPDSLPSRRLLGDIYLAHGWHDAAYRQYRVLTERAPAEALFQLRLAAAAAGAGRTDEALRLERGVIRTPGRPGPDDPRRWAALCSAARLGGMLAGGQGASAPDAKRADAIKNKLKELQLFRGASRLVLLSWTDLGADVALGSLRGGQAVAVGEATDAAASGLAALMLSPADLESVKLRAFLRSPRRNRPLKLQRLELAWDGKDFSASQRELELPADATAIDL